MLGLQPCNLKQRIQVSYTETLAWGKNGVRVIYASVCIDMLYASQAAKPGLARQIMTGICPILLDL